MDDQKNLLLAIVLTGIVLIGWQYFFAVPQLEKQKQIAQQQQTQQQTQQPARRCAAGRSAASRARHGPASARGCRAPPRR